MVRFLNKYEELTYDALRQACQTSESHVFAKVRLADILPINGSRISDANFKFCLQSHADFLVTNSKTVPQFCVEFDGPTHSSVIQRRRDETKNGLFDFFGMPLLRINGNYLNREFRGINLLSYFVEVWFLNQAFDEAQARGDIPLDADFDPALIAGSLDSKQTWPYWLSLSSQLRIKKLHNQKQLLDFAPSSWVGRERSGVYRAVCWIRITQERVVFVSTAMQLQRFPAVVQSELLDMIAVCELEAKLAEAIGNRNKWSTLDELDRHLAHKLKDCETRSSSTCGWAPSSLHWGKR